MLTGSLLCSPVKGEFLESLRVVHDIFGINSNNSYYGKDEHHDFAVNENNRLLWEGSKVLGYQPEKIPRNVKKCVDCGHCGYGCSHKSKQSTMTALMEPMLLNQMEGKVPEGYGKLYLIPDCSVSKIKFADERRTKAIGVEAVASIFSEELPTSGLDRTLLTKR